MGRRRDEVDKEVYFSVVYFTPLYPSNPIRNPYPHPRFPLKDALVTSLLLDFWIFEFSQQAEVRVKSSVYFLILAHRLNSYASLSSHTSIVRRSSIHKLLHGKGYIFPIIQNMRLVGTQACKASGSGLYRFLRGEAS